MCEFGCFAWLSIWKKGFFGRGRECLGDRPDNESVGLNASPTGIVLPPSVSFATLVKGDMSRKAVNFRTLVTLAGNGGDVVISRVSISAVNEWLNNTVRFHDIPITVFTEDGLSDIATKLGNPLMLDSYTVAMCTNYWGRASYARAMVELRAYSELKDTIVVVVPKFIREGYTMSTIRVEYEPVQSTKKTDKAPAKPKMYESLHTQEAEQVEGNGKKDINTSVPSSLYYTPPIGVVSSVHGSTPVVCGSLNATPLAGIINKLERQMLDGKLTLVDDHGKLLNKVDSDPVNSDSESDVEVAYDETVQLMASGGANDAILYEDEDYD
ncbi:hypothetical protein Tco_0980901, partial [Tanacetum coccineum]